tara:strand:- start:1038 stop:2213 length:1176 start_codon:yes stop_codon:yes gene_type:complete
MNLQKDSQRFLQNDLKNISYSKIENDPHTLKIRKVRVLKEFKKLIERLENEKQVFSYGGRLIKATQSDLTRIISEWPQNDSFDLSIRNIILNGIITSEGTSPGSGISYVRHLINDLEFNILESFFRSEVSDVKKIVRENIGNGICFQMIKNIIDSGSLHATFEFVETIDEKFSMVIEPSFFITGRLHELFSPRRKKIESSSVLFIDGILEKLSEIDRILQGFAQSKRNLVIFARGFSPNVANTLNTNFLNKNLRVFPFVLVEKEDFFLGISNNFTKIDKDSILMLNKIDSHELESFYDLVIESNGVRILNIKSIDRHIKINVPKHFKNAMGVIEDRIRQGIYTAQETAKYGYVITESNKKLSRRGYEVGKKCARSSIELIEKIGCIILQEK